MDRGWVEYLNEPDASVIDQKKDYVIDYFTTPDGVSLVVCFFYPFSFFFSFTAACARSVIVSNYRVCTPASRWYRKRHSLCFSGKKIILFFLYFFSTSVFFSGTE